MTILHLSTQSDWDAALESAEYRTSTRGATLDQVGYIHASYPEQLAEVAEFVYAGTDAALCVLVIDERRVAAAGVRVVDEDGDGRLYPHIYGALRPEFVIDVIPAAFDDRGAFVMARPLYGSAQ
ncbi:DUF952 domain-containing protein [Microbacterium sp.]|uniref:DUF952 domain-containing protein n=1 Tax=Microbacterium sp. TaxID=51671 RepID=UPI00092ABAFF|nr:DUF952 domain-containing protein [Microbacterium sp.]MBN9189602.1 DUF952 domain-containing protein [Microbacterium sp.]MBN9193537.1 DUF952 domain-containing protein [Microbacterium sp.]OJU63814.1 MAG: hypothetical protein BGO04_15160 [Microbacterium sp. 70-38]